MEHGTETRSGVVPAGRRVAIVGVFGVTVAYIVFQLVLFNKFGAETYPTFLMPGFRYGGGTDGGVSTGTMELEVRFDDGAERYSMRELARATGLGHRAYFLLRRVYPALGDDEESGLARPMEAASVPRWVELIRWVQPTFRVDQRSLVADPERRVWLRGVVEGLAPGRVAREAVFIRTPVTVYGYGEGRREEVGTPGFHRVVFEGGP